MDELALRCLGFVRKNNMDKYIQKNQALLSYYYV